MTCACCGPARRVFPERPTGVREPLYAADALDRFSPREREAATRFEADALRSLCHHEAAHAVAALATGAGLVHVTVETASPHSLSPGTPDSDHLPPLTRGLIKALAGALGEAVVRRRFRRPRPDELAVVLHRVRQQDGGQCDECRVARMLLIALPDDESRVAQWLVIWDTTYAFFEQLSVRLALARVAAALERDVVLTGAQVEALVDVESLRAAIEATIAAAAEPELLPRTEGLSA